jgi:hypothetical protein
MDLKSGISNGIGENDLPCSATEPKLIFDQDLLCYMSSPLINNSDHEISSEKDNSKSNLTSEDGTFSEILSKKSENGKSTRSNISEQSVESVGNKVRKSEKEKERVASMQRLSQSFRMDENLKNYSQKVFGFISSYDIDALTNYLLFNNDVDVCALKDTKGYNVLHLAAYKNDINILNLLVSMV